ncbi:hypothetical protein D0962_15385 [Leptolyngbyaceae cyanobacterium CCMR0082]|uniref:Uncharacterized protein n=1 Tax=Adonisia turfae CCMR0082 TaxID=2304604 RepID=A0A6M0S6Y3_9CYAN|nr:hypothetical protein [Adonisia turfae]NEZ64156.1 hypothetical protein [Adonisia turfae CCMR0082]
MAKVSIRDAVLDELKQRYPQPGYTTSDRVLKLLGEVEALGRVPCKGSEPAPGDETPTESLSDSLMDSLMSSVSVE